jgi:hypothetical protein
MTLGGLWYFRHRRRRDQDPTREANDEGLPEISRDVYQNEEKKIHQVSSHLEADGNAIHEIMDNTSTSASKSELAYYPGHQSLPRDGIPIHELIDTSLNLGHGAQKAKHRVLGEARSELPLLKTSAAAIHTPPVEPNADNAESGAITSPSKGMPESDIPPRSQSDPDLATESVNTAADMNMSLNQAEEEMERIRQMKQRLQHLQALEEREEELRSIISERKGR